MPRFERGTGRKLNGGIRRRVSQATVLPSSRDMVFRQGEELSVNVTHPGAFFLIIGWNASFARDGLARIRMSDYLEEAQGDPAVTEAQAGLEELLFD